MDEEEKRALSTSLPELIHAIEVNTRFKAAVTSSRFLDDDFIDRLFESPSESGAELVFRLVQYLKKTGTRSSLEQFTRVLTKLGQHSAVEILQREVALHRRAYEDLKAVERFNNEAGVAVSSTIACSTVPDETREEDIEELRKGIARTLPIPVEKGFIAISDEYCDLLYKFVRRQISGLPGPLQLPDPTKPIHDSDAFRFISPQCSALLTKRYRSQSTILRYSKVGCWWQLQDIKGRAEYYRPVVVIQPGGIKKRSFWMSANATLRTAFAEMTCFEHFRVASHKRTDFANLSLTIGEWASSLRTNGVDVYRDASMEKGFSLAEKQKILHNLLNAEGHVKTEIAVASSCEDSVVEFAKGKTDKEPNQLKCLDSSANAYNEGNVSFMTAEAWATVLEFFATNHDSKTVLTLGEKHNCMVLRENEDVKYIGVAIYVQPADVHIGSYYLLGDASLKDGIAATVGTYPEKAQTRGTDSDLDLDTSVREWFKHSKGIQIAVWL